MTKSEKIKYLLAPAVGFGMAGVLLGLGGLILFQEVKAGILLFGLTSSLSLVILEKIKVYKKVFIALAGAIIWTVVISVYILGFIMFVLPDSPPFDSVFLTTLMFLLFFLSGPALISLFYALSMGLLLKVRAWPIFWRGAIGFLFIPIPLISFLAFENSIGAILGFVFSGIVLGLLLGWGRYRAQRLKEIVEQKREKT